MALSYTIVGTSALDSWPPSFGFAGAMACDCPDVEISLARTSSTTFRATFSWPVLDTPDLTLIGNYRMRDDAGLAPDLAIHSVVAEDVASPTYIDLETDEQRTGVDYVLDRFTLERA